MPINQLTSDAGIDVSFNSAPEFAEKFITFLKLGSVTTSAVLSAFVADKAYEAMYLECFGNSIPSGTLAVDFLVNGVSILTTTAQAQTGGSPTGSWPAPAVFATTRIDEGDLVVISTTADSATATDVFGHYIIRPLLGHERVE